MIMLLPHWEVRQAVDQHLLSILNEALGLTLYVGFSTRPSLNGAKVGRICRCRWVSSYWVHCVCVVMKGFHDRQLKCLGVCRRNPVRGGLPNNAGKEGCVFHELPSSGGCGCQHEWR